MCSSLNTILWIVHNSLFDPRLYMFIALIYCFIKLISKDGFDVSDSQKKEVKEKNEKKQIDVENEWKLVPLSPQIMKYFKSWKTVGNSVKLALGVSGQCHVPPEYLVRVQHFLNEQFGTATALPLNTIAVSIASEDFRIGDSLHEFEPLEKNDEETFFTYDQPTENLQFTYCHTSEEDFELAGMCFYFPETSEGNELEKEMKEIQEMFEESEDENGEQEEKEDKKENKKDSKKSKESPSIRKIQEEYDFGNDLE